MNIPIHGLSHATFSVSDLDVSVAFYLGVFGADLLTRAEGMAYLDIGGVWVALNVQADIPRSEIAHSYTHLAFSLADADMEAMGRRLAGLGITPRPGRARVPGEGRSLYFADPDGHLLEFHSGDLATRLRASGTRE